MRRHTIGDPDGVELRVLELGAAVQELWVPDAEGRRTNVVLGSADEAAYRREPSDYWGAVVGRVANRLRDGRLVVDGVMYDLDRNDGAHTLHGGRGGFHSREWAVVDRGAHQLTLELVSPDGDQGFPGTLTARVTYTVGASEVTVGYRAATDAPTAVNLAQHSHFNLSGAATVADHTLRVAADRYTPVDDDHLPVGDPEDVSGTRFDLRSPTPLGPLLTTGGLDHNYVLQGPAVLADAASGRTLEVTTDRPGLQVYTGNFFDGSSGHERYAGVALETQAFPGQPDLLAPGDAWESWTRWRFGAHPPRG